MWEKENKGGTLSNSQIEQEIQQQQNTSDSNGYKGSQDTGDAVVRDHGTDVQKRDGLPDEGPTAA